MESSSPFGELIRVAENVSQIATATIIKISTTVPSAPRNVTATAGNASVKLTWIAPSNNGGSAITNYLVEYQLTEPLDSEWLVVKSPSSATNLVVTGLTNGGWEQMTLPIGIFCLF
jgi:hypothetical protein